jgi:hypothetical protein
LAIPQNKKAGQAGKSPKGKKIEVINTEDDLVK